MVTTPETTKPFRILTLDGGGSKGLYTLGVLEELEAAQGRPLHEIFDLIYGTSTGSIITGLIALGEPAKDIRKTYRDHIPKVMRHRTKQGRTRALEEHARRLFRDRNFEDFKTRVGIVSIDYDHQKPCVFKSDESMAHGRLKTFSAGFATTIADAVLASCAAYPFFKRREVTTPQHGRKHLLDGGFVANNPTLLAIADATNGLGIPASALRVLSIGTGRYPERYPLLSPARLFRLEPFRLVPTIFKTSTNTIEALRAIIYPNIRCVRVDTADPNLKTSLLEYDDAVLDRLHTLGRNSYGTREKELTSLLAS